MLFVKLTRKGKNVTVGPCHGFGSHLFPRNGANLKAACQFEGKNHGQIKCKENYKRDNAF